MESGEFKHQPDNEHQLTENLNSTSPIIKTTTQNTAIEKTTAFIKQSFSMPASVLKCFFGMNPFYLLGTIPIVQRDIHIRLSCSSVILISQTIVVFPL